MKAGLTMHYLVWMNNCFLQFIYIIIVILRVSDHEEESYRNKIWNISVGAHVLQGIHIEGSHPMSSWNTEKRTSFMISLFASVQNVYLWFGARYGFDSFTLIVYTSLHASSNAVELARQHKIGVKKKRVHI